MFPTIEIAFYPDAKTEPKAIKTVERIAALLGPGLTIVEVLPHDSVPNTFRINGTIPLNAPDIQSALFQALSICKVISPAWTIQVPERGLGGNWEFWACAREGQFCVSGLTYVAFTVSEANPVS